MFRFIIFLMFLFSKNTDLISQETISSFLEKTHKEVHVHDTVHLVLGNQSADLDSIASAIVLAYFDCNNRFSIPLINIPREELFLRKDVLHIFANLGIDPDFLLFREDLEALARNKNLSITLVDHNELAPGQEYLAKFVQRIVDHRRDTQVEYPMLDKKIIKRNASNATIVAQILKEEDFLTPQVAYLLLAAIILDSKNLTNEFVVTQEDIAMANLLKEKAEFYHTDSLFQMLFQLRHDVHGLTPNLLLRKDFKLFNEGRLLYGISSMPLEINWSSSDLSEWYESVVEFVEQEKIHLLFIIGYKDMRRTLIVYAPNLNLATAFKCHVMENTKLLSYLMFEEHDHENGLFFYKHNLGRKLLQPLFSFTNSEIIQNAL